MPNNKATTPVPADERLPPRTDTSSRSRSAAGLNRLLSHLRRPAATASKTGSADIRDKPLAKVLLRALKIGASIASPGQGVQVDSESPAGEEAEMNIESVTQQAADGDDEMAPTLTSDDVPTVSLASHHSQEPRGLEPPATVCYRLEELSIDDDEAKRDVDCFLRSGFNQIRHDFGDILGAGNESWPTESHLGQLIAASSGLFIFASTILKYIGDPNISDPDAQLNRCLLFLSGSGVTGAVNPLLTLDLLYMAILSDIPDHILPITNRILAFCTFYPIVKFSTQELANFLRLDKSTFYTALRKLHSVMDIPSPDQAHCQPLRFYHPSFDSFLKDPARSGKYALDEKYTDGDVVACSIHWSSRVLEHSCPPEGKWRCSSPLSELE